MIIKIANVISICNNVIFNKQTYKYCKTAY
jgi:hypothetical protein